MIQVRDVKPRMLISLEPYGELYVLDARMNRDGFMHLSAQRGPGTTGLVTIRPDQMVTVIMNDCDPPAEAEKKEPVSASQKLSSPPIVSVDRDQLRALINQLVTPGDHYADALPGWALDGLLLLANELLTRDLRTIKQAILFRLKELDGRADLFYVRRAVSADYSALMDENFDTALTELVAVKALNLQVTIDHVWVELVTS